MRPVNKGTAQKVYINYGDARHDLAEKIGYYCSYCEMGVTNMIEVEHIQPISNGGNPLDWNNFLLSCKYCNTVKKARNNNRTGYLWPDIDNTDLAFEYSLTNDIQPINTLSLPLINSAQETIDLMGLDRKPGGRNNPTDADTRWVIRELAWEAANKSFNNWIKCPQPEMATQIGITSLTGNYSIWCEVFKTVPLVLREIDIQYLSQGLHKTVDANGQRIIRLGGQI